MPKKNTRKNLAILSFSNDKLVGKQSNLFSKTLQLFLAYLRNQGFQEFIVLNLVIEDNIDSSISKTFLASLTWDGSCSQLCQICEDYSLYNYLFISCSDHFFFANYCDLTFQHLDLTCRVALTWRENLSEHSYDLNKDFFIHQVQKESYSDGYLISSNCFFSSHYIQSLREQSDLFEKRILQEVVSKKISAYPIGGGRCFFLKKKLSRSFEDEFSQRRSCLFLDRDGVLIKDTSYPYKKEHVVFNEKIFPILKWAKKKGMKIIVITNQAGIAKGKFSLSDYYFCEDFISRYFELNDITFDQVIFCPFHPQGKIPEYQKISLCRKPSPGMILKAMQEHSIDLQRSLMIGDKDSDELNFLPLKTFLIQGEYMNTKSNLIYKDFHSLYTAVDNWHNCL